MGNAYLETISDFLTPNILEKELERGGKKQTFYFKELMGDQGSEIWAPFNSKDDSKKEQASKEFRNKVISAVLCDKEGKSVLSSGEVGKAFPQALANQLLMICLEHNGINPDKKEEEKGKE